MSWDKEPPTYTLKSTTFVPRAEGDVHILSRAIRMVFAPAGVESCIQERVFLPPSLVREAPGSYRFVSFDQLYDLDNRQLPQIDRRQLSIITRALSEGDFRGHTEERMVHEVYWQLHVHDILGWGILATFLPEERAWADKTMRQLKEIA